MKNINGVYQASIKKGKIKFNKLPHLSKSKTQKTIILAVNPKRCKYKQNKFCTHKNQSPNGRTTKGLIICNPEKCPRCLIKSSKGGKK